MSYKLLFKTQCDDDIPLSRPHQYPTLAAFVSFVAVILPPVPAASHCGLPRPVEPQRVLPKEEPTKVVVLATVVEWQNHVVQVMIL